MPAPTKRKAAPRAYHKGNVAEDLRATAAGILEAESFEDVTVRRLCRDVGVTPGNFYNHYPSLDDLLLDLAADAFDRQRETGEAVIAKAATREEAVVAVTVEFVEFGHAHPELFRTMFGQVGNAATQRHERYQQASRAGFGTLVELIYGENIYRPEDIVWSHVHCGKAYALFAFAYGLARLISMEQIHFGKNARRDRLAFVDAQARIFLQGLDAGGAAKARSARAPAAKARPR